MFLHAALSLALISYLDHPSFSRDICVSGIWLPGARFLLELCFLLLTKKMRKKKNALFIDEKKKRKHKLLVSALRHTRLFIPTDPTEVPPKPALFTAPQAVLSPLLRQAGDPAKRGEDEQLCGSQPEPTEEPGNALPYRFNACPRLTFSRGLFGSTGLDLASQPFTGEQSIQDLEWCVKMGVYIGFWVHRGFWLLWLPVNIWLLPTIF